nr:PREDICTED: uncharacterized protein LOC100881290 [Megachile rotundata]
MKNVITITVIIAHSILVLNGQQPRIRGSNGGKRLIIAPQNEGTSENVYSQNNKCGARTFRCKNGECVAHDLTCDGRADCRDETDETYVECSKKECSSFQFQCSYGACVERNAVCNGIKDCVDNSDETLSMCALHNSSTLCPMYSFRCNDGLCIPEYKLCDGRSHCTDNSDETSFQCGSIRCSETDFRCSYGACISANLRCDGDINCADGSDENPTLCRNKFITRPSRLPVFTIPEGTSSAILPLSNSAPCNSYNASTPCSKIAFSCNDGQYIPARALCDGVIDCADNSDEIFHQCKNINCLGNDFHCSYGACISANLKCNGVNNCADGSDEDPVLCRSTTTTTTTTTVPYPLLFQNYSKEPVSPAPPTWSSATCIVPARPENGYRKLHKPHCCDSTDSSRSCDYCDVPEGTIITPGEHLVYSCNSGYKLKGDDRVFCTWNGELLDIPYCIEIRCESLESNSRSATCRYRGDYISCQTSALPDTEASLKCRNSYRQDTTLLSTSKVTRCNKTGQWEPKPIQCVPECGIPNTNYVPLIVNGTQANINEFPWHGTLYKQNRRNGPKEFLCGTTIIHEKFLITAAHCVADETNPSKYYVATGNIYRDYDSSLHHSTVVKKSKVKNIYVPCNYRGLEGNYAEDIAIIEIMEPFAFSSVLVPICLDITKDLLLLDVGDYGKVAGFGKTSLGTSSYILQTITVPYISKSECRSASSTYDTAKFITSDKFCAGYTNGTSVCDGDSGSGLIFKRGGVWYLGGIVSVSISTKQQGGTTTCNSHEYTLYTSVSEHISWIQDLIQKLETRKPIPPC